MSKKHLGHADIKVDGDILKTLPGAKLNIGGFVRKISQGNTTIYGYTEAVQPATIECEIAVDEKTSLAKIREIEDAVVSFTADTGQQWVISEAWCAEPPSVNDNDAGKASVKLEGSPAEEMM